MADTEIRALLERLQNEKKDILDQTGPMRAKYEDLQKRIHVLEIEAQSISADIKAKEQPRLGELGTQISGLAKALGGKTLSGQ